MSSKTPEELDDKSHNTRQLYPHRQVHVPSVSGPLGMTAVLPPGPSDFPMVPLGPISSTMQRASENERFVPLGMADTALQSQWSQEAENDAALADSPSITDSSRLPGAGHSDGDREVSPSQEQTTAKSKRNKRTRTLTTAPQAAALFALLARTQFPTTSEREEIGRAIGLSARKVQIWFQNQRQKQKKLVNALKPQSQSDFATSTPLPLVSQPSFSAAYAVRLDAASGLSDNESPGAARLGIAMRDCGAVILHPPNVEGITRSLVSVSAFNPYQSSPPSDFSSCIHPDQSQRIQGHPQFLEYTHGLSQDNAYPSTTIPDSSFLFGSEPSATSSLAAKSWLSEDIQQGPDVTSLPHSSTGATSPHLQWSMPPTASTAPTPVPRSLYNAPVPGPSRPPSIHYGTVAPLLHSHDNLQPTDGGSAPLSQMASLYLRSPAHRIHRGSFAHITRPSQRTFPSTPSGHILSSSLTESLNTGVHRSPHSNLVPPPSTHSQAPTPHRSQAAVRSRGAEVHSESPPMNRKRPRSHEETLESKQLRQWTAGSLSPPASSCETAIPFSRNYHAMHVPLPTHPALFQGHITDPFSEAVPQPGVFDSQRWLGDNSTNTPQPKQ